MTESGDVLSGPTVVPFTTTDSTTSLLLEEPSRQTAHLLRLRNKASRRARSLTDLLLSHPIWLILIFSAVLLPVTILRAIDTPLSYDETYTSYLSHLPQLSTLWSALGHAVDEQPPLFFLITRLVSPPGAADWTLRIPSIAGFWFAALCLMFLVGRHSNLLWGAVAAMFFGLTGAYFFATNARPYGLVLGLAAAGLLCWQCAIDGRRRKWALFGLWLSMVLALNVHYYAVLLYVPLGLAEAVRTYRNRKADRGVCLSLFASLPAMLAFLPLIRTSIETYSFDPTRPVRISALWTSYGTLLNSPATQVALLSLIAVSMVARFRGRFLPERWNLPFHETTAVFAMLALPLPAMVVGFASAGALEPRYIAALTLGAAVAFALTAYQFTGGRNSLALALLLVLTAVFVVNNRKAYFRESQPQQDEPAERDVAALVAGTSAELPLVVLREVDFVSLWRSSPPALRGRLVYVTRAAAEKPTIEERNMTDAVPYFGWPVLSFELFRTQHRDFLVYKHMPDSWYPEHWLLPTYQHLGARVDYLRCDPHGCLFQVTQAPLVATAR